MQVNSIIEKNFFGFPHLVWAENCTSQCQQLFKIYNFYGQKVIINVFEYMHILHRDARYLRGEVQDYTFFRYPWTADILQPNAFHCVTRNWALARTEEWLVGNEDKHLFTLSSAQITRAVRTPTRSGIVPLRPVDCSPDTPNFYIVYRGRKKPQSPPPPAPKKNLKKIKFEMEKSF